MRINIPDKLKPVVKKSYKHYINEQKEFGFKHFTSFNEYVYMLYEDIIKGDVDSLLQCPIDFGLSRKELYNIVLWIKGGKKYRGIKINKELKEKGILPSFIVNFDKNMNQSTYYIKNLHPDTRLFF